MSFLIFICSISLSFSLLALAEVRYLEKEIYNIIYSLIKFKGVLWKYNCLNDVPNTEKRGLI